MDIYLIVLAALAFTAIVFSVFDLFFFRKRGKSLLAKLVYPVNALFVWVTFLVIALSVMFPGPAVRGPADKFLQWALGSANASAAIILFAIFALWGSIDGVFLKRHRGNFFDFFMVTFGLGLIALLSIAVSLNAFFETSFTAQSLILIPFILYALLQGFTTVIVVLSLRTESGAIGAEVDEYFEESIPKTKKVLIVSMIAVLLFLALSLAGLPTIYKMLYTISSTAFIARQIKMDEPEKEGFDFFWQIGKWRKV